MGALGQHCFSDDTTNESDREDENCRYLFEGEQYFCPWVKFIFLTGLGGYKRCPPKALSLHGGSGLTVPPRRPNSWVVD